MVWVFVFFGESFGSLLLFVYFFVIGFLFFEILMVLGLPRLGVCGCAIL